MTETLGDSPFYFSEDALKFLDNLIRHFELQYGKLATLAALTNIMAELIKENNMELEHAINAIRYWSKFQRYSL